MQVRDNEHTSPSIVKYLDHCLYYGFHVLVVIVPLSISYKLTYDQFDLPKLMFLRIISIVLLLCFIAKFLLENQIEIKKTKLDYTVLAFLSLIVVSCVFSVHPLTSVFGKYRRYEGLLTLLNYGLLFFLAAQFFRTPAQVKLIMRSMTIAAGVVSVYGLLQYFGLDFLHWALPFESGRSFSTFGNPVLLGGYLVIVLPISLGMLFSSSNPRERTLYSISFVFILACLIATYSRGAWLGGLLCLVGFFILCWRKLKTRKKIVLFVAFLMTISIFALAASLHASSQVDLRERVGSAIAVQGSALTRAEIWKSAAAMAAARPIFGFGPDTFRLAFRKYQTLEYKRIVGESSIADNAHNYFLQIASTAGIPAVFTFILIITLFAFSACTLLSGAMREREYVMLSGCVLSVYGYLVHLFFGVSVIGSTSLWWLILGILAGLGSDSAMRLDWRNAWLFRKLLLSGATLASLLLIALSIFPFLGDFHFARAQEFVEIGYYGRSVDQYHRASWYAPFLDNYHLELGLLNMKWARATEERMYFARAVTAFQTAEKISPLENDTCVELALAYLFGAKYFGAHYRNKAIYELRKAIALEPYSSYAHYLLGTTYIFEGDLQEGVKNLEEAVDITPNFEDAQFYLGFAYEKLGRDEEAIRAYHKTLSLNAKNWAAKEALKRLESK